MKLEDTSAEFGRRDVSSWEDERTDGPAETKQQERHAEMRAAAAAGVDAAVAAPARGERGHVVEVVEQEVMSHVSPDGRSPDSDSKAASRKVLTVVALAIIGIGAGVLIYVVGGIAAIVAGAAYVVILVLAASPVWGAGLLRRHEEHEVKLEVSHAMRERRRFWWSGPRR